MPERLFLTAVIKTSASIGLLKTKRPLLLVKGASEFQKPLYLLDFFT